MITRTTCRVCQGSLNPILSLGELYVSNFIMPGESDGIRAPLDLVLCSRCKLLQLKHTVPGDSLYRNYWYRSGTNQTMCDALADIATRSEALIHLRPEDSVLDIGCNDGTLLGAYRSAGIFKIGFDPAQNMASFSRCVASKVVTDFFTSESFHQHSDLTNLRPKIITTIAMFYDLEDPCKFVSDIKSILHPEGLWVIQMSYLPFMLRQNEFGNICHEHLEYYSIYSLEYLLGQFDFELVDVELNDINGGSIRVYVRHRSARSEGFSDSTYRETAKVRVDALREQEADLGLENTKVYTEFAFWIERIKRDVVGFIRDRIDEKQRIYVYGASTKGNTLLQYFGLDNSVITAAAERNPDKWGRLTVGTHIPIISEQEARTANPDYFLVLPWHFLEEFKRREIDFLLSGGRFILPAPFFTLV